MALFQLNPRSSTPTTRRKRSSTLIIAPRSRMLRMTTLLLLLLVPLATVGVHGAGGAGGVADLFVTVSSESNHQEEESGSSTVTTDIRLQQSSGQQSSSPPSTPITAAPTTPAPTLTPTTGTPATPLAVSEAPSSNDTAVIVAVAVVCGLFLLALAVILVWKIKNSRGGRNYYAAGDDQSMSVMECGLLTMTVATQPSKPTPQQQALKGRPAKAGVATNSTIMMEDEFSLNVEEDDV